MSVSNERVAFLLRAYTSNRITKEELDELAEIIQRPLSDASVNDFMQQYWASLVVDENEEIQSDKIFNQITSHRLFDKDRKAVKSIWIRPGRQVMGYAASVLLLMAVGVALYISSLRSNEQHITKVSTQKKINTSISGASKKAVLTLADGSKIQLQGNTIGAIAFQGNFSIMQNKGLLSYNVKKGFYAVNDYSKNTMSTPKGGEYQLILHDGTRVWLNAASSITYPVEFSGGERRVKIQGEAYFEVAKNAAMPFIVEANGSEVKVLGTHFNISAYLDDTFVKTTLVEGSVNVRKGNKNVLLKPNQQALIRQTSREIAVSPVDVEEALAWKNGYFMFNGEDIKSVMKLVSRWYDVDVVYQGDLEGKTFGGTISRFGDINELLKTIELTEAIHFEIKERRIIVMP